MSDTTRIRTSGFAARYAAALYALAFERHCLDRVVDEMAALGRLLTESQELARLVRDPLVNAQQAKPLLSQALAAQGFSTLVVHFVETAINNRRLRDLPKLVAGFAAYTAAKRGETVADIRTAHALSDVQRNQLRARLMQAGYSNVQLIEQVEPALLGGMILKIGASAYDTSLKSRLARLTHTLKGAA